MQAYHIRCIHNVLIKFINIIRLQNYVIQTVYCILRDMQIGSEMLRITTV